MAEAIFTEFPEIDIETTVTVGLWRFHNSKMELPVEVQLCPIGMEAEGWRRWAINQLIAAKRRKDECAIVIH